MLGRLLGRPKAEFEGSAKGNSFRNATGISRTTRNLSRNSIIFTKAAQSGNLERLKMLVTEGRVSQQEKDISLVLASGRGHLETVRFLLGPGGADVNGITPDKHTALTAASVSGHLEVARLLIESGADINATTTQSDTSLIAAIFGGHLEIAELLIESGANVNAARRYDGGTALMFASRGGHLKIVALLIERGANVNAVRKDDGATVLIFAAVEGYLEIVRFLVEHGANVNATTTTGVSAVSCARTQEIRNYLKGVQKRPPSSSLRGSQVEAPRVVMNPLRTGLNPWAGLSAEIEEDLGTSQPVLQSVPPLPKRGRERLNPLFQSQSESPRGGRRTQRRKGRSRR